MSPCSQQGNSNCLNGTAHLGAWPVPQLICIQPLSSRLVRLAAESDTACPERLAAGLVLLFFQRDGLCVFIETLKRNETYRSRNPQTSSVSALTFSNGENQFLASGG